MKCEKRGEGRRQCQNLEKACEVFPDEAIHNGLSHSLKLTHDKGFPECVNEITFIFTFVSQKQNMLTAWRWKVCSNTHVKNVFSEELENTQRKIK